MSGVPDRGTLARAVAERRAWAVAALEELVRAPTLLGAEEPGQRVAARLFAGVGLDVRVEPVEVGRIRDRPGFSPVDWELDGKTNVVGLHDPPEPSGRSLILNGHIDVVSPEPVSLWTSPPFEPRVVEDGEDGETWMFGRGAGDMKGGSVCFLWALAALRDLGLEPAARVVCQSVVEEECTGNGALSLLERGWTADAALIPEPFGETIQHAQVGVLWFRVRVLGRTTHVLGAGSGVNAIERTWPVIRALRGLEEELNRPENLPEPWRGLGHPLNLNVGTIAGGDWQSTVAGECVTGFRIGALPGADFGAVRRRVEECVARAAAADPWLRDRPPTVEWIGFQAEGCTFDADGDFGRALRETHAAWRGAEPVPLHVTATTDARIFQLYGGIPTTCYGPRAVDIHGVDERVSIDSMQRVAEVIGSLVGRWCGIRRRPA